MCTRELDTLDVMQKKHEKESKGLRFQSVDSKTQNQKSVRLEAIAIRSEAIGHRS